MFFSSTTAMAAEKQIPTNENEVLVEDGYTEDGVYYEVTPTLNKNSSVITINSVITVEVTRKVVYYSILTKAQAQKPISWSESMDGYTTLSGTLYWKSFVIDYNLNTTEVTYQGTLTGRV